MITNQRQQGFTIVELMVAATLGLLILAGAISMFISNKRIYTEQDEMGRLQENARFAMNMLIRDIRMAGYSGCNHDIATVTNHITGAGTATSIHAFTPVEGSEAGGNWQPSGASTDLGTSDGITLRYLDYTDAYSMTPAMSTADIEIYTSRGSGFELGDRIAIADCNSADIVVVTGVTLTGTAGCTTSGPTNTTCQDELAHVSASVPSGAEPGNATSTLSKVYDSQAQILEYVTARYFIANDADGNPVLNRRSGEGAAEAIIEGVENMQILYGEDTTGNDQVADTYVNAGAVTDWNDVVSVRIALLVRSIREYGADLDTQTYDLLGTTFNPTDDRRRRRVFTTTVQIRNRISDS